MNVLVIGGGGREHALVWKIAQSPRVKRVYCAPGNGGIAGIAQCVDIEATDFKALANFAKKNKIDLTVVGPEQPLVLGIIDYFHEKGLAIFGPSRQAAELEGSKAFAKKFMADHRIPTAAYRVFEKAEDAEAFVNQTRPPYVLKADGLASGKGVVICNTRNEAFDGIEKIMKSKSFGEAGSKLVIEEFMRGEEVSVLAITDGENVAVLPPAQDHKAIFEGDAGPNTGGMGAYSPAPVMTSVLLDAVREKILLPTIRGMKEEGRFYQGVLYAGLMVTSEGPKVMEYNCRFGDPEIQSILPLLKTDLVDLMLASIRGEIADCEVKIHSGFSVCVVMASKGYPDAYEKGKEIFGLNAEDLAATVFHAGTQLKNKRIVTSGGRVLGVTATGSSVQDAIDRAYRAVGRITFDGAYYRRDIGYRALRRDGK